MLQRICEKAAKPLLALIGVSMMILSHFSSLLPLQRMAALVGASISLFVVLALIYDRQLHDLGSKLENLLMLRERSYLEHTPLTRSIPTAYQYVGQLKHLRIFALSSIQIEPIFQAEKLQAEECSILLYSVPSSRGDPTSLETQHELTIDSMVRSWQTLQSNGCIGKLTLWRYNFFPTEYFLIFDDKALVVGHYVLQDNRVGFSNPQSPFVVTYEQPEGREMIDKYIEVFQAITKSKRSQLIQSSSGRNGS